MFKPKVKSKPIANKVNQISALKRLTPQGKPSVGAGQLKNMSKEAGY